MAALDIWTVAAAVLINKNSQMHYNTITDKILQSGLTNLARKGTTPEQTVGAILRETKYGGKALFVRTGEGYYKLNKPSISKTIPDVKKALELLNSNSAKLNVFPSLTSKEYNLTDRIVQLESVHMKLQQNHSKELRKSR